MWRLVLLVSFFPVITRADALDDEIARLKSSLAVADQTIAEIEPKIAQLKTRSSKNRDAVVPNLTQGRLTSVSNTPVSITDPATNTVIYFTPYNGNKISLYKGIWRVYTFSQLSYTLSGLTTGKNYDIFIYAAVGGIPTLEVLAWTNDTTRATALSTQDGVLSKSTDTTRKYLGTFRTNAASAANYDDTTGRRFLWNYYNRVPRKLLRQETTVGWTATSTTWRRANGNAANLVEVLIGWSENLLHMRVKSASLTHNGNNLNLMSFGIGIDSTTVSSALMMGARPPSYNDAEMQVLADYLGFPGVGYHAINWLEIVPAGTNTDFGTIGASTTYFSHGLLGYLEG
jgi:hypothetical protein